MILRSPAPCTTFVRDRDNPSPSTNSRVRPRSRFPRYCALAFGTAFVLVCVALLVEFSGIVPGLDMGYGDYYCWIGNVTASGIFIALPLAAVMAFNVVHYVKTVRSGIVNFRNWFIL